MIVWLVVATCFLQVQAEFCFSQCQASVNLTCGANAYDCATYGNPFTGLNTLLAGYSPVEMFTASSIVLPANNYKSSVAMALTTCSVTYPSTLVFSYDLLGKFVSTDYIYKRYTITQPHYQIILRLSIAYIGVWSGNDYLNVYASDGVNEQNIPLRYSCTDAGVNYTEIICGTRVGNKVDCLLQYSGMFPHNSTYLLINISSLTREKDPNVQFWSLFDINIITVNCNSLCSACYAGTSADCTACAAGSYLTGNTCGPCAGGMYQLSNPNTLLGGECVSACPQGYYVSGSSCVACASGCLSCTSASVCLLSTSSSTPQSSLWKDKMAVWIIIIIVGVLFIGALIWCLTRR